MSLKVLESQLPIRGDLDSDYVRVVGADGKSYRVPKTGFVGGLTEDIKTALLDCFAHVAWTDDQGQTYYDALESALYPPATLSYITAVYTQSGTVYDTDSLDSLKTDLVVTAHYDDSSTAVVTTYTLSGSLTAGTSTITVSYSGKTTTFNVTVTESVTLSSITCVYTQSGTVYDTDSLDSLKADLVVTAHYSDSSSETVPSTDYTLSGTLTAGTSTVTVSYSGKTTTFTVTVTAVPSALYPLENGTHTFTNTNRQLIVSDGTHIEYTSNWTTVGSYINLSNQSDNDDSGSTASNINNHATIFTIPANSTVRFVITNISALRSSNSGNIAFALRSGSSSSAVTTGNKSPSGSSGGRLTFDDIDMTFNITSSIPVGCVFVYLSQEYTSLEADIELYVDNVRWI